MTTKVCGLCRESRPITDFASTRGGKGRLRTCSTCVAELLKTDDGAAAHVSGLCFTCGHWHPKEGFSVLASATCTRCVQGPLHGAQGSPSSYVEKLELGWEMAARGPRLTAYMALNESKLTVMVESRDHWMGVAEDLRTRLFAAEAKLKGTNGQALTRVVPQAVSRPKQAQSDTRLIDRTSRLPATVGEAALIAAMDALAAGSGMEDVLRWLDDGLYKMKDALKDHTEQARMIKAIFESHRNPRTRGELMRGNPYGLGHGAHKVRVGKTRMYYRFDEKLKVTIIEVERRGRVYEHGAVENRKQSAKFAS